MKEETFAQEQICEASLQMMQRSNNRYQKLHNLFIPNTNALLSSINQVTPVVLTDEQNRSDTAEFDYTKQAIFDNTAPLGISRCSNNILAILMVVTNAFM